MPFLSTSQPGIDVPEFDQEAFRYEIGMAPPGMAPAPVQPTAAVSSSGDGAAPVQMAAPSADAPPSAGGGSDVAMAAYTAWLTAQQAAERLATAAQEAAMVQSFGQSIDPRSLSRTGGLTNSPGIAAGIYVDVSDTGLADTVFTVTHNLGYVPTEWSVVRQNKAGSVYDDGAGTNNATQVQLKASVANMNIRLLVW